MTPLPLSTDAQVKRHADIVAKAKAKLARYRRDTCCPHAHPLCAAADEPDGSHCTHWQEHGEVCCNCGSVLPHDWWKPEH